MKNKNKSKRQPYVYIVGLIIILVIVLGIFYRNSQYGTLQIKSLDKNLMVFVDNQRKTDQQDVNPKFNLKNGSHTIVVAKEKFWPWTKEIQIERQKNLIIQPFFVPQNTSGLLISKEDSEYSYIISLFQKDLISNTVMKRIIGLSAELKTSITAIDFYKNRQDVVIISSGEGVYVLEIDSKNIQNFQPIYKGRSPLFVKKDDSSIYILDNNNLILANY